MNAVLGHWMDYIWFVGIPVLFILIVLWVLRPKAKKHWKQDAQIPFADAPGETEKPGEHRHD